MIFCVFLMLRLWREYSVIMCFILLNVFYIFLLLYCVYCPGGKTLCVMGLCSNSYLQQCDC